jgi:hypothetical protein
MIIVFAEKITNQLAYIVDIIFEQKAMVTSNENEFCDSNLFKINYSNKVFTFDCFTIIPHSILFETEMQPKQIICSHWNNLPIFFNNKLGDLPFDIFAASFYLITRYEEYFDAPKNIYGNYLHKNSIAFNNNFLEIPLVNLWLLELQKLININFYTSSFKLVSTFDVDIAFKVKGHWAIKNWAVLAKKLFTFCGSEFVDRILTMIGLAKDSFDVFDELQKVHSAKNIETIYFILVALQKSKYDKNPKPYSKAYRVLINKLFNNNEIGIHPSFYSSKNDGVMQQEKLTLEHIANTIIDKSRQHYLQLQFPKTYNNLLELGIAQDFSMGYGTSNGFRASYCKPFYWFNVSKNCTTNLLVHPFCYMDSTCIFEQKLSIENIEKELMYYYNETQKVGGTFTLVHHNHFMANEKEWTDYKKVYLNFLSKLG